MTVINRHLSDKNCARTKDELGFLLDYLTHPRFRGELAIEFRGPSELSVYDRGFRLAQIRFSRNGEYRVGTHPRFIEGTPLADSTLFPHEVNSSKTMATYVVEPRDVHALLQMKHLMRMRSNIKGINYKEEIGVAHVIAADTMKGTDVVVVDREVGDSAPEHRGERLDLLALQRVKAREYRFLAVEVKLGNNPELDIEHRSRIGERSAVEQVEGYAQQIDHYFGDYAACYRKNVEQKLALGLLTDWDEAPTIVTGARALLVVVGYAGIAGPHLDVIAKKHPKLWVKSFDYGLKSRDGRIAGLTAKDG